MGQKNLEYFIFFKPSIKYYAINKFYETIELKTSWKYLLKITQIYDQISFWYYVEFYRNNGKCNFS